MSMNKKQEKVITLQEGLKRAGYKEPSIKDLEESAKRIEFEQELTTLIRKYEMEKRSGVPASVIAGYLSSSLKAFDHAIKDLATADHAHMMEEALYTASAESAGTERWSAPANRKPCLSPGYCGNAL